jgi:hypothetical protein
MEECEVGLREEVKTECLHSVESLIAPMEETLISLW